MVVCAPPTVPLASRNAERGTSVPPSTADNVTVAADPKLTVVYFATASSTRLI